MFDFSIHVEKNLTYAKILISGDRNYDEFIESISSALNSIKTDTTKFMIVDESETCFSVSEIFNLILEVLHIIIQKYSVDQIESHTVKIAYYNQNPEALDMMQFAETVSINRGLNLKVFTSDSDTLDWLGKEA